MRPLRARKSLAEEAADQIREEVLAGRLGQGERLVEVRVAEALNISRGPVREAFKLLRAEGLLEEEQNRGTYVVRLSSADVREVYDLRAAIEARAAKMLAMNAGPADLEVLRSALEELKGAAARGDVTAVSRADLAFHETVCQLTGNGRLHAVFMRYVPVVRTLIRLDEHLYSSPEEIAQEHEPMLAAIEARDPDAAAARFEAHIDHAYQLVSEYLERLPDRDGRAAP
ncbi:MAG TPA: GntR family transcriptional regulator [Gaiellales bacterium]|jgi:DNA-binding GntR family transcriptional regulator|nr:GntR family transcriptional regulator [Gaiellales bacterium]